MAKVISDRFFLRAIIISLSALIAFHGMVLTGIVPFEIVWGEKIKNASQMYKLETISIIVNVLMLLICSIKAGNIKAAVNEKVINFLRWYVFCDFKRLDVATR